MTKINDTTVFPITTPADADFVIGTDVSNTTNSAGGETVNFKVEDLRGIGSNQSWQNMTSSRALNTNYTNTTGKPIAVNIESTGTSNNMIWITATVDGVSFIVANDGSAGSLRGAGNFIVPTGSTYKVAIATTSLASWHELR